MKASGIYALINKVNGKVYVGQSVNMRSRILEHKNNCNNIKKNTYAIYNAIRKYGWENFYKIVLEYIHIEDIGFLREMLTNKENFWINYFDSLGRPKYNVRKSCQSNLGIKYPKHICDKMKNSHKSGFKHTEESKKLMSLALKGKRKSEEHKEKLRQANLGKKLSIETRKKLSEKLIGNKRTLGYKHSEEAKRKISEAGFRRYHKAKDMEI